MKNLILGLGSCALWLVALPVQAELVTVLSKSEVVPVAPLGGLEPHRQGLLAAAASVPVILPLPSGDIAGFGSAVASSIAGRYEYVVVGAPGALAGKGRVFVYQKALESPSFGAPTEILPPISSVQEFGASVELGTGTLVVGAPGTPGDSFHGGAVPNTGKVFAYSQPYDPRIGFNEAGSFSLDVKQPTTNLAGGRFGSFVELLPGYPRKLIACHEKSCQSFYRWARPILGLPPLPSSCLVSPTPSQCYFPQEIEWNPERIFTADSASHTALDMIGLHTPLGQLELWKPDRTDSYGRSEYSRMAVFDSPGGVGPFAPGFRGTFDFFLASVWDGNLSRVYLYRGADRTQPAFGTWNLVNNPVAVLADAKVGTVVDSLGDTWVMSNTNASGTAATAGAVYRIKVNRNCPPTGSCVSWYDYTDDQWTRERIASGGGPKFGAGLALNASFAAIGDPSNNQVILVPNDQVLVRNTYEAFNPAEPQKVVTISMTTVSGSAPPTLEEVNCATTVGTAFSSNLGPCVSVRTNASLVGEAQVCYPNPTRSVDAEILRCVEPALPPGPACQGRDKLWQGKCCSKLQRATIDPDPFCVRTEHFSSVGGGIGNDQDGDFINDFADNCISVSNFYQTDTDTDGVGDACDNCPNKPNADQQDGNNNGIGDACDAAAVSVPTMGEYWVAGLGVLLAGVGAAAATRRRPRILT